MTGNFNSLIKNINPNRKLLFEFTNLPEEGFIKSLHNNFNFKISKKILSATMSENKLQDLLKILLKDHVANNISFEDLPVDDSMRNFFQNPDKYI